MFIPQLLSNLLFKSTHKMDGIPMCSIFLCTNSKGNDLYIRSETIIRINRSMLKCSIISFLNSATLYLRIHYLHQTQSHRNATTSGRRTIDPEQWSSVCDQKHRYHLETCQRCKFPCFTSDPLSQKLWGIKLAI